MASSFYFHGSLIVWEIMVHSHMKLRNERNLDLVPPKTLHNIKVLHLYTTFSTLASKVSLQLAG